MLACSKLVPGKQHSIEMRTFSELISNKIQLTLEVHEFLRHPRHCSKGYFAWQTGATLINTNLPKYASSYHDQNPELGSLYLLICARVR